MSRLTIWVGLQQAATLSLVNQEFTLAYLPAWKEAGGYAFSPHLALDQTHTGATVKNFFSNLLPEGQMLESLSSAHQVSKYDVFGILRKIGRDCAGALVILDEGETPEETPHHAYERITEQELHQRVIESQHHHVPLMFWKRVPRMSLAGVQNKLGVYLNQDGSFALPITAAPTSHILKIGDPRYESVAANEYFCMQLARALGLNVPDTLFKRLPAPVFLVKRYDREWTPEGKLIRTHQIDGCQALNLPAQQKYEEPEYTYALPGADLADIYALAALCKTPALARTQILQWILFNYLIGNSDAHAKNISFLINPLKPLHAHQSEYVEEKGITLAPLYDLVSTTVYGFDHMAQHIGGENKFALIKAQHWAGLQEELGIKPQAFKLVANNLCKRMKKQLALTVVRVQHDTQNDPVIQTITQFIENQAALLLNYVN
jgi:serine/threonine-protein kinase HipA